jgi:molybdopterin biosynthesis enzyme
MIASAARADALVAVEAGEGELSAGEEIRYIAIA